MCEDASIKRYVGHSDNIVTVSNATCYPCICFEVLITRGDSFVLTHYPSNLSATLDLENSEGKKLATSCPFVFGPSQACCHCSAKCPDIWRGMLVLLYCTVVLLLEPIIQKKKNFLCFDHLVKDMTNKEFSFSFCIFPFFLDGYEKY